jgi:hypothetical protein
LRYASPGEEGQEGQCHGAESLTQGDQAAQTDGTVREPAASHLGAGRAQDVGQTENAPTAFTGAWRRALSAGMARQIARSSRGLTGQQRNAPVMLAGCLDGHTEAVMKANGFGIGLLAPLVRDGLLAIADELTALDRLAQCSYAYFLRSRPATGWRGWSAPVTGPAGRPGRLPPF